MIDNDNMQLKAIPRARVVASQVVACLALDLLLIDLGMSISFVTIVLPEVLNAKEGLSINDVQASWFGSMAFLCQPLGSIFSGPILDYFGRKRALILVNLPHLFAWLLMYYAWNIPTLFIANALLGIGTGIMEAPSVTYVGEVSDSSIRGILTTLTGGFTAVGMFMVYLLGKVLHWREAALVCLSIPLISMLLVFLVPESPIWLLSKGRQKDALRSLCRLRGWAPPDNVKEEFNNLLQYNEVIHQCVICIKTNRTSDTPCDHNNKNVFQRAILQLRYIFFAKETIRPFTLVFAYFLIHTFSGLAAVKSNMVNVCRALGMAYDAKTIVVFVGALYIVSAVISAAIVKLIGKRKLVVSSTLAISTCSLALSIYSAVHIDRSVFSYEPDTFPEPDSVTPVVLFMLLVSFTNLGIPWVLLSEVFPFRSRGIATGFAAACTYAMFFVATKTNYNLEYALHLSGAFGFYAACGYLGTVYLYLFLPETENKTLVEIEAYYKGNYRIFADDPFINMLVKKRRKSNEDAAKSMMHS